MNEDLIDLLTAVLLYIEAKTEDHNPFVKKMGVKTEQEAFKFLIDSTKNCEYLFPEIDKLNNARMAEIRAFNNIEATDEDH